MASATENPRSTSPAISSSEKTAMSDDEIRERVQATLKLVELEKEGDKSPSEISGGMRKRAGMARALAQNAIKGVTEGFSKDLDIVGVGYRAQVDGNKVVFALGYSHPVVYDIPNGIDIAVEKQTHITVTGVDRQLVGQVAANLRSLRKPDPYQQKGVRYTGEVLKKKVGKTGA
jgi:ribosomal protein L6